MPRRAAKKDRNHKPIAKALEAVGVTVLDTSGLGDGFPDMICFHGERAAVCVEVKMPGKKLTPNEIAWQAARPNLPYIMARGPVSILIALGFSEFCKATYNARAVFDAEMQNAG